MDSPDTRDNRRAVSRPAPPAATARRRQRRSFPPPGTGSSSQSRPTYSIGQQKRCQAANKLGAVLTAAARDGRSPYLPTTVFMRLTGIAEAPDIIAQAAKLAADPPPGALRIGRTRHGAPVAVVLHAAKWSLVLWPHRGQPGTPTTATTWAFLDGYHDGTTPEGSFIDVCFDRDHSALRKAWTDMVAEILTLTV